MNSLFVVCLALTLSYATATYNYRTSFRLPQAQDLSTYDNTKIAAYQQPKPQLQIQPTQTYGGYATPEKVSTFMRPMQTDIQTPAQVLPPTPEDIMCQGKQPGTVIPLEDTRIYVTCLDDGKGVSQMCPRHLHYIVQVARCDKKPSQLLPPCLSNPCQNGGQCSEVDIYTYRCDCPAGFEGQQCERDQRTCMQNPCGQDGICKGFRFGSALTHVCICQGGNAYGPSCQQAIPNQCASTTEQYLPLGWSDKGFLMCDGERFHVESCPGFTVWDNSQKTCWSPEVALSVDQNWNAKPTYQQAPTYQQTPTYQQAPTFVPKPEIARPVATSAYTSPQFEQPRVRMPVSTYQQTPQLDITQQRPMIREQAYGGVSQLTQPAVEVPKPALSLQNYGQQQPQLDIQRKPMMMREQPYSSTLQQDMPQQRLMDTSSMYAQRPMQQDTQPSVDSYGNRIPQLETPKPHRPEHIGGGYSTQQLDMTPQKSMLREQQPYSSNMQQDMQPQRFMDTSRPMQQDVQPSMSSFRSSSPMMLDQRRPTSFDAPKPSDTYNY